MKNASDGAGFIFDPNDPISLVEAALRAADDLGEREALALCDQTRRKAFDEGDDDGLGAMLLAESLIYERLGKGMSRDLHAVAAAEAFLYQGELGLARIALGMVDA